MMEQALTALDRLGGVHFLVRMGNSKVASDRSAVLAYFGRLLPLQVDSTADAVTSKSCRGRAWVEAKK
jgi:hypothetical protein